MLAKSEEVVRLLKITGATAEAEMLLPLCQNVGAA